VGEFIRLGKCVGDANDGWPRNQIKTGVLVEQLKLEKKNKVKNSG